MLNRLRIWAPIAVVALVLLGGYLVANRPWEPSSSDGSLAAPGDAAPSGTRSAPIRTPSPAGSTRSTPTARTTSTTVQARYDLAADERKGGHTLSRHIGKTDDELRARLKAEPDISAASTYTDRSSAEKTVAAAMSDNASKVVAWRARKGDRPNLVLDAEMPLTIGRTMRRGQATREADSAVVVLKWDGKAGFVLTSYPQER